MKTLKKWLWIIDMAFTQNRNLNMEKWHPKYYCGFKIAKELYELLYNSEVKNENK